MYTVGIWRWQACQSYTPAAFASQTIFLVQHCKVGSIKKCNFTLRLIWINVFLRSLEDHSVTVPLYVTHWIRKHVDDFFLLRYDSASVIFLGSQGPLCLQFQGSRGIGPITLRLDHTLTMKIWIKPDAFRVTQNISNNKVRPIIVVWSWNNVVIFTEVRILKYFGHGWLCHSQMD